MAVLAIDPGSDMSAFVVWDGETVGEHAKWPNEQLLSHIRHDDGCLPRVCVIEQVASYGMPVGAEVFETVRWAGRFEEAFVSRDAHRYGLHACHRLVRREVKLHLCGQARAKDSNIRQAVIDRFGGKEKAIGKKASQGPLYGLKADEWQALALAIAFHDSHGAQVAAL
jgi:hypothetical protein